MRKNSGNTKQLKIRPCQQPSRKESPPSYIHKGLNSANNFNESGHAVCLKPEDDN